MAFLDQPYTITREDADLYVEQVGPDDAPAVLYLHGGPGYSSHSFRELMGDDLEDYRVLYADQRGGGRSYTDAPVTLDRLADDVRALLDALRLPSASLLAHGFGALVAVRAAELHPDRVERLVLVGPWLSMPRLARTLQREAARQAGAPEDALPPESRLEEGDAPDPEATVAEAFERASAKQVYDALQFPRPNARMRLEHADALALFGPHETEAPDDVWRLEELEAFGRLRMPRVVIAGRDDRTSVPDQVEPALEAAPEALLGLIEGGHYPWLDEPDAFVEVLRDALRAGSGPA